MTTTKTFSGLFLIITLCLLLAPISAQPDAEVYVTTQDNSALRAGPGRAFDQLATVPPATTLRAIGRTQDTRWVQVEYEGQRGWIAYWLLVWTGDIISLPVDGVNPLPFVRRIGVSGITTRGTRIYARQVTPSDQIGTIPAGEPVEVTGRLGGGSFFWLQVLYKGQLYWVGSWDIRITGGSLQRVLNTAYLFPYGRVALQLDTDINQATGALSSIESIWLRLGAGESVSCGFIPAFAERSVSDADVQKVPVFAPLVVALDSGIASVNRAIAAFGDACSQSTAEFFLTQDEVRAALENVRSARRELVLADSLLGSLQLRDPLLGRE